ncbi:MAG: SixA phosphatase family protein [bacterium]
MARTLILLRHAKSAYPPGVADHDRPLAPRGQADAPAAGRWLAEVHPEIDAVVLSPARRTRETWALVSDEAREPWPEPVVEPRVYEAEARTLLDVVRALPPSASKALVIGHNPGLEDLAIVLAGDADPEALRRLALKFPTSAIAVVEVTGEWADLPRGARLSRVEVPRG